MGKAHRVVGTGVYRMELDELFRGFVVKTEN